MKHLIIAVTMILAFATAGCMSSYYGQYERDESIRVDTLPPAMTKQDIIALTKEGISGQVIIYQIKAMQSYFQLNAQDIIDLKKAGVSDTVLSVMINPALGGAEPQTTRRIGRRYSSYPSSYGYPSYYPYGYSRYSSLYLGLSYGHHYHYPSYYYGGGYGFNGHYSGGYYGGGHYSGGHGSGGHRTFGSHR